MKPIIGYNYLAFVGHNAHTYFGCNVLVKKWKNKFLQAGIKPRIFLQIIVGCKTLQHLSQHFGSFLFVSECKHARRKKAEISIALVIYNKMIEF